MCVCAEVAKCVLPIKLLVYSKCQCTSRHLTFHADPRRKGAHFKDAYPFTAFHSAAHISNRNIINIDILQR